MDIRKFIPPCVSVWPILKITIISLLDMKRKYYLNVFSCDSLPGTVVVTVVVVVATIKCRYVPRFSCVAGDMYRYCSCFMQIIVKKKSESR